MKKHFLTILFFVSGVSSTALLRGAPNPEKTIGFGYAIPAFAIFILFFISLCSTGAILRSKTHIDFKSEEEKGLFDITTGAVGLYLFAYSLLPFGMFKAATSPLLWIFLTGLFHFGREHLNITHWFFTSSRSLILRIAFFILPLMIGIKLIEGLQFHQHGDAYITYLVGPRALGSDGNFDFFLRFPSLFLTTSFETLFAWGTALMGLQQGHGLDLSQWFSQWVTSGIGLTGSLLGLVALCRRFSKKLEIHEGWIPFIAISSIQVPSLSWTQNLAKNDTGVGFLGIASFFFMTYFSGASPLAAIVTGATLGALVVGKFVNVILGVSLVAWVLIFSRRYFHFLILGGLLGILPILVRNFLLTQNPFFPWVPGLFPSPLYNDFVLMGGAAATRSGIRAEEWVLYLKEILRENYFIALLPFTVFYFRKHRPMVQLLVAPLLTLILFTIFIRPSTEIRYQGPTLILVSFFASILAFSWVSRIQKYAPLFLMLLVLANSNLTFFTLFQLRNPDKFSSFSERMPKTALIGGPAKVWIRNHIGTEKSILSLGDSNIYYLMDYPLTEGVQSPEYGSRFYHSTLNEVEGILKTAPFDYLYLGDVDFNSGNIFKEVKYTMAEVLDRARTWAPSCLRFQDPRSMIWDLKCLNSR